MNYQDKQTLKDIADALNRLSASLRDKDSGALTPESRFAIAGSYALHAIARSNGVSLDETLVRYTIDACKEANAASKNNDNKALDFQN